jgi:sugar phosphate isomerase/epimerase
MQDMETVIWLIADETKQTDCLGIKESLISRTKVLVINPGEAGFGDLRLGPDGDLEGAIQTCPPELRPAACLNMHDAPLHGLDCPPCPVLGYGEAAGLNGQTGISAGEAAEKLLEAAQTGYVPKWLPYVQINLPLKDLLGKYRPLIEGIPLNLEVGLDGPTMDRLTPGDMEEAKALLAGRRVTSHMPFFDLSPGAADPEVARAAMRRLDQAADLAIKLGAEQAVAHLGYDPRIHRDLEAFANRLGANLLPLVRKLRQNGCSLALENTYDPGPEVLLAVLDALEGEAGAGICLDLGHVYGFSQTGLADWWQAVSPRIIELHMHDNDGKDDLHWPIGWGMVDWQMVYDGVRGLDRKVVLTMEPHNEPHLWASFRGLERIWGPSRELLKI